MLEQERKFLIEVSESYPYPIANSCWNYLNNPPKDSWEEWGVLSRKILQSVLTYLSHLLLVDLVYMEIKPAILYHRIQQILSRPMIGHYAGFLRETSKYYKEHNIDTKLHKLIDFIYESEIKKTILPDEQLIGKLVNLRNTYAHGKIDNESAVEKIATKVRELTILLLKSIDFIKDYTLVLQDGTSLMNYDNSKLGKSYSEYLYLKIKGDELLLRPLLIKAKGTDVGLIEDHDIKKMRLVYKGNNSYEEYRKKHIKKGKGKELFESLVELLKKVRSFEVELDRYDFESFKERSNVVTARTLSLYEDMQKYIPSYYIPREEWEGDDSIFKRFLESDKTLLTISGEQGTGKSALLSHLAKQSQDEGHSVLLINAQRFTFANVTWSDNPYPEYFSKLLHYKAPLTKKSINTLLKTTPEGKKIIFFIDALNEVEGITIKWNRFKALHLLLHWISSISQPNLKVIVSFRSDQYLEYDELDPVDLPSDIEEISYPGNNPHRSWITDLSSFDIKQAERLYNRLQKLSDDLGMAPAMSWEQFLIELGDKQEDFIKNPLIFTVLLKIHHRLPHLTMLDKERLFLEYANKLTGVKELNKRPKFIRALTWLVNGNMTKKELFIADSIEKMTEVGNASFLMSSLSPNKKKRDKRIQEFILNSNESGFKDLKEGGIFIEEKIERVENDKEIVDRRISFVAEIMAIAMENIIEKKNKFQEYKAKLYTGFLFLVVLLYIRFMFLTHSSIRLGNKSFQLDRMEPLIYLFLTFIYIIINLLSLPSREKYVKIKDIGIMPKSFFFFKNINNTKIIFKLILIYVLPSFFLYLLLNISVPFLASITLFSAIVLNVDFSLFITKQKEYNIPLKNLRIYAEKYLNAISNEVVSKKFRRSFIRYIIIYYILLIVFILFLYIIFRRAFFLEVSYSFFSYTQPLIYMYLISLFLYSKEVIILISIILLSYPLLLIYLSYSRKKVYIYISRLPKYKKEKYYYLKITIWFVLLNLILYFFIVVSPKIVNSERINFEKEVRKVLENKKLFYIYDDDNMCFLTLDLSVLNSKYAQNILEKINKSCIKSLLTYNKKLNVDFSKYPKLYKFWGYASSIRNININGKFRRYFLDLKFDKKFLESKEKIYPMVHLSRNCLYYDVKDFGDVFSKFKQLVFIDIYEYWLNSISYLKKHKLDYPNSTIHILKRRGRYLNLEWLNNNYSKYILWFQKPINNNCDKDKLKYIKRLIINGYKLNFEHIKYMKNLKWIYISNYDYTKEWLMALKSSLKKLDKLECLSLGSGEFRLSIGAIIGKFVEFQGKANIMKNLDYYIEHPEELNNKLNKKRSIL